MSSKRPDSTLLLLIRHAETDWNNEYRFQGHSDTPLNEAGRATIPYLVEALRFWKPAAVYTSDLLRASEMALAAAQALGIESIPLEGLRECNYGNWEGKTLSEVAGESSDKLELWRNDEAGIARGGGESLKQMQERTWSCLEGIADAHPGETVAIFTHSGPIRGAVCTIFGLSMAERYRFQVNNASISALKRTAEGEWQLILLNQAGHPGTEPGDSSPAASRD